MYKYCPIYVNGALPLIEEGDVFKVTLKYEKDEIVNEGVNEPVNIPINGVLRKNGPVNDRVNDRVNELVNKPLNDNEISIISLLKITPGLNANEISEHIKKSIPSVARYISSLKKRELIEFRGAAKTGGYYIITEKKEEK
ncbi:MAG: ArsR family transcriptional regulator [Bacteroidetes bacterium]|nr:ArsR family transcriptional regulator [Bacteroidota bacterium]